jgi:hypothetical protein
LSYAIAAAFAAVAILVARTLPDQESQVLPVVLALLFALGSVGLARRLVWGRMLVTFLSFVLSTYFLAVLIPVPDDLSEGGSMVERTLGTVPVWLEWFLIVIGATFPLALALVVGWRRSWFRSALW